MSFYPNEQFLYFFVFYCQVYNAFSGRYSCKSCSSLSTNLVRKLSIYNGLTGFRCLNTQTEYEDLCRGYKTVSGKLECEKCKNGYEVSTVLVNFVQRKKCLLKNSEVIQNCKIYTRDSSLNYICTQCIQSFGIISNNGKEYCVYSDILCTAYTLYSSTSKLQCSLCSNLGTLLPVYFSFGLTQVCIHNDQIIRNCSHYVQGPSNTYICSSCIDNDSIILVEIKIDGVSKSRCLFSNTELVQQCDDYSYQSGIYSCTSCKQGFIKANVKVSQTNLTKCLNSTTQAISGCSYYQLIAGQGFKCLQCLGSSVSKTVVSISNIQSQTCLNQENSFIVNQCTVYKLISGIYQCNQCQLNFNKVNIEISPNTIRITCLSTNDFVQNCTTYLKVNSLYQCNSCMTKYEIKTDKATGLKTCELRDAQRQCSEWKNVSGTVTCINCSQGFTLKFVQQNGQTSEKCISSAQMISECVLYRFSEAKIQCVQCNQNKPYSLATVIIQDQLVQTCIKDYDLVDNCFNYNKIGLSCSVECHQCRENFVSVALKMNQRIYKWCLDPINEYLPHCNIYLREHGTYFCRRCGNGSIMIPIGGTQKQLACATIQDLESSGLTDCEMFQRPKSSDTSLTCLT